MVPDTGLLVSVSVAIAVGAGTLRLLWAFASRIQRGPAVKPELPDRALYEEEIAARDVQIQQLEERLDFVERALATRSQYREPEPGRLPKETTPV
jgi:hypothetical protein